MTIDDALLDKLEKLSMLKVDEAKREEVKHHLASIVSFMENLGELDEKLKDFSPEEEGKQLTLRADEPRNDEYVPHHILEHAPKASEGFFVVP